MTHRGLFAFFLAALLFASTSEPAHASPDVPMCVAEHAYVSDAPISRVSWRAPMCGPFQSAFPVADARPLKKTAIEAYRKAGELFASASYEEARLQLDLASRGLPRISDRIAIQSGRLELLRKRPVKAAEFFQQAERSPVESVRVEASAARAFALLRADASEADTALGLLLASYPSVPDRSVLLFERAQSLVRQERYEEAIEVMHQVRVEHPGARIAVWADAELQRLQTLGYQTPSMSDLERVQRARKLLTAGPLDEAKLSIGELLESPLTGEQHAEVHYLAGRLARFEGRWKSAETYMRTAQLFPMEDLATAKYIEHRASDMAETATARDPQQARLRLSSLRAGRRNPSIPSNRLIEMITVASTAGLQTEVDELLVSLNARGVVSASILFDAAMAATGTAQDMLLIRVLERIVKQGASRYRTAALYHLARTHERMGHPSEAQLFFTQAQATADSSGNEYYALWSENGLERLKRGERPPAQEGLESPAGQAVPKAPRASNKALAAKLQPLAELHAGSYPWLARAADLLRVGERDAATEELFEAYLAWRDAQGKPVARAGLDCVARADGRTQPTIATDVRTARLELSTEDRATLSAVAAALGDMGTAGGFTGPALIEALPRAYEWLAVPAANRYGLDPNLLLAVMRVESAYQKHIVSYAGAVGLMQIMPRTGQLIAHALGREDFSPADLLDPQVNLEFAAWYLTSLIRRFDGRLPLAIASYNGGPHNVRRWIQQSPENAPLDVLLEQIPFTQTHRYVRRVLTYYEAYRQQRDLPMPPLSVKVPEQRIDPLAF